MGESQSHLDKL